LRRVLAGASPAAYTPDLAASLNNLAAFLSEAGERSEALEAAREAADLYKALAGASPAAYTPDLAASLNTLANRLSEAGERDEALHIFIEDFDRFSPATRARLLLARASWRHDNQEEDLMAAAHEADGKDVPALLGPARREVACAVANSKQILEGLPSWAVATIDAETRNRIESWLNCADLAERANLLEKMWKSPSESDCATLCAAAELYVDVPPVRDLAVLVDRVAKKGIQNVTFCLRWQYRAQMLATDWYSAHKGGRGARYLRKQMVNGGGAAGESHSEWGKNMADPDMRSEVFRLLEVSLPEEEANKLKSIFCLADLSSPETAYEVYGRAEDAEDALEELLGNGNWRAMVAALEVRPTLKDSGYGAVAAAFAAAMNNDTDRALEFMKCACRTIDSIDRQRIEGILERALHEDGHPQGFVDIYKWFRRSGEQNE
ncbi:tetratricopeptide repeat protein, partial [Actinomyces dentalis]|uniref:tetratricopeptide repeat protein n=1 Tax=Actinomyces dentalis TaxID=272548 RepID=UPI0028EAFF8C